MSFAIYEYGKDVNPISHVKLSWQIIQMILKQPQNHWLRKQDLEWRSNRLEHHTSLMLPEMVNILIVSNMFATSDMNRK